MTFRPDNIGVMDNIEMKTKQNQKKAKLNKTKQWKRKERKGKQNKTK